MKNLQALFVAAATVVLASAGNAAGISTTGQADPTVINASGTIAKYVNFTHLDTEVGVNLGSPTFSGQVHTGGGNSAIVTFDSNTHLTVSVTNGGDMSTNEGGSTDTLPTNFILHVQGREVRAGVVPGSGSVIVNGSWANAGTSGPGAVNSFNFMHGYASGVGLDVEVTRSGVDDHFGAYNTNATLVWADLN